jgi:hypothetical protein
MNTFTTKVQEIDDTTMSVECRFNEVVTVEEAFQQLISSQIQEVKARCLKITLEIY